MPTWKQLETWVNRLGGQTAPVVKGRAAGPKGRPTRTEAFLSLLHGLGFRPSHIVDVGGNHGNWTRAALRAFPDARVTMFEPQTGMAMEHGDLAADPRVKIDYAGLGDLDGTAAFSFHARHDSCSFLYSAEEAARLGMPQETMPIRRLDTAMAASGFGAPQMVKIDAEGLDLKVIAGGPRTIAGAEIVLVEAMVACPTYPNTLPAVIARMDELGFRLFDITDLNRTPERKVLWMIEAVFVRRDVELATKVQAYV
jgi:FkbM family methyltransferase